MWKNMKPKFVNQIRVNRGLYYHHGVYLSDDEVIHYSAQDGDGILDPSKVSIMISTIDEFLKEGVLEVRQYTQEEEKIKRSPLQIATHARKSLGKKGYDLIKNNCEHFSNECFFGESKSEQVDNIINIFANIFK